MKTMLISVLMLATVGGIAAAAEVPSAEKFYASKCASCHAKDGRGNAKMVTMLKVEAKGLDLLDEASTPETDAAAIKAILEGKGKKMPTFKAKMEGLDAADLLKYIYSLKKTETKK